MKSPFDGEFKFPQFVTTLRPTFVWPCLLRLTISISLLLSLSLSLSLFFSLFRATLVAAYMTPSSQARCQIRDTAAGLRCSHSNTGSKPHLWPTSQLMAMLDLNPLSEARDWTRDLMDTSQVCYRWATMGIPPLASLMEHLLNVYCAKFSVYLISWDHL